MSSTETGPAATFFADLILPLRRANIRRGIDYLDRGPRRPTYWGDVVSRTGGMEQLSSSTCDAAALLGRLGDYWTRRREPSLPQLLPYLETLRQELNAGARPKGPKEPPLPEFVYPLS